MSLLEILGRSSDLMVSVLVLRKSGPDGSQGQEHSVVFLGKITYSQSASLLSGV